MTRERKNRKKEHTHTNVVHVTRRACGICGHPFAAQNPYERFCRTCKETSEEYRFSEWMQEVTPLVTGDSDRNIA